MPDAEVQYHAVSDRVRRAGKRKRVEVERLRKESGLPHEKEMALRVSGASKRSNQEAIEFAIQRGDVNAVLLTLRRRVIGSNVEEMLAVREKEWPAMCGVEFGIELGDGSGSTTR